MEPLDIHCALALHLFEAGKVTLAQATRLASLPLEAFIELLGQTDIATVSYPPEDLEDEGRALTNLPVVTGGGPLIGLVRVGLRDGVRAGCRL